MKFVDNLDIYYEKGYLMNWEQLTHAHFKENDLYKNTIKFDKSFFFFLIIRL
jgi:hypothetical protein